MGFLFLRTYHGISLTALSIGICLRGCAPYLDKLLDIQVTPRLTNYDFFGIYIYIYMSIHIFLRRYLDP